MSKAYNPLSRDNLRVLNPKVFERAAEMILKGEAEMSCCALSYASEELNGTYWCPERDVYREVMGPKTLKEEVAHPFWDKLVTSKRKPYRANALLFVAAAIRDAKSRRGKKAKKSLGATHGPAREFRHVPDPSSQWPFPLES
jgi:hypothetical protein